MPLGVQPVDNREYQKLAGDEKEKYLLGIDRALQILTGNLATEKDFKSYPALFQFGEEKGWDWSKLPENLNTYQSLAALVDRVRQEYQWFSWRSGDKPSENKGFFEEIGISARSGLPWLYDFMTLHSLKGNSSAELSKLANYEDLANRLKGILMQDYVPLEDVRKESMKLHKEAMKRAFIEDLQNSNLIDWRLSKYAVAPEAKKIRWFGAEELWKITALSYSAANSVFQAYVIDLWQDNLAEPQIVQDAKGNTTVSAAFSSILHFSEEIEAWYILKAIDDSFENIHPVHVSRAIIGPYENKFMTIPKLTKPLAATLQVVKDNVDAGIFRFIRQYSYAPTSVANGETVRQEIYQQNWSDEVVVCPASYASLISKSVKGTDLRIFEM